MASAALLRPLFSLPTPAPRSATPCLSLSSSSLRSFLVDPPWTYRSAAIHRSRGTAVVVVRAASSEEEEASADIDTDDVEEEEVSEVVEDDAKLSRKPRVKLGDIMGILNKRAIEASVLDRPVPDIRTGDIVEIKLEVPENRRRLSIYKGIVISKQNAGVHTTIRIRRIIAGVGVEIVFPVGTQSWWRYSTTLARPTAIRNLASQLSSPFLFWLRNLTSQLWQMPELDKDRT